MSFYLLHILHGGCTLKKERGNLIYRDKESTQYRQIALEDLRGVILAAPDVMLSDYLIRSILAHGAFILHCDEKYKPVGITAPLQRLINQQVAISQARATRSLNLAIWERLVSTKIQNQINLLKFISARHDYLIQKLKEKPINESACARYYWGEYFKSLGYESLTRRHDPDHVINGMLNYGYAVLGALGHRSLVAHGLSPLFGVHHKGAFHGYPLVYDIIEPWRPFVDSYLYRHLSRYPNSTMQDWLLEARRCWEHPIKVNNKGNLKLVDAMDYYIQLLSTVFLKPGVEKLWLPELMPAS